MTAEINLTTGIRLLSQHEFKDALACADSYLGYDATPGTADELHFARGLFSILALELVYRGYATVEDVIERAGVLASMGDAKAVAQQLRDNCSSQAAQGALQTLVKQLVGAAGFGLLNNAIHRLQSALPTYRAALDAPETKWGASVAMIEQRKAAAQAEHRHPAFNKILALAKQRKNILLVGPAGTGKTHAGLTVAQDLGLPFASISVSAGMSTSQLTGWIMPGGYLESDFVRLYENGGIFLLDEMDAADANTLTVINQALANGSFHIAQRTGNTEVKKHPDFICIGAANTYGTGGDMIYAGREQLDAATLDRFMMVHVDYDKHFESLRCAPEILTFAHELRQVIATLKLRRVMSTRKAIDLTDMLRAGWSMAECKECFFAGWSSDEKSRLPSHLR